MRDRVAVHRHTDHGLLGARNGLGDSLGCIACLAHTKTHVAMSVAYNRDDAGGGDAATLDGLAGAVNTNYALL